MQGSVLASGPNYAIKLQGRSLGLTLERRPELTLSEWADAAEELFELAGELAKKHQSTMDRVVWELSNAPLPGVETRRCIAASVKAMATLPIELVCVTSHPTMRMFMNRLTLSAHPEMRIVATLEESGYGALDASYSASHLPDQP